MKREGWPVARKVIVRVVIEQVLIIGRRTRCAVEVFVAVATPEVGFGEAHHSW